MREEVDEEEKTCFVNLCYEGFLIFKIFYKFYLTAYMKREIINVFFFLVEKELT